MIDKNYKLIITKKAMKDLSKLDIQDAKKIVLWMNKNLSKCNNPRLLGKALTGNKKDLWRYRVGNYRIISTIKDDVITIEVLTIGHRRLVYDK